MFGASVGSINAQLDNQEYLFDIPPEVRDNEPTIGELDFDFFLASAAHAEPPK